MKFGDMIQFLKLESSTRDQLDAPIKYDYERKGFYYSKSNFSLPSISITEGELMALFVAEKVLKQYKGTPYEKELRSAYEKLTANLPDEISIDFQELDRMFTPGRIKKLGFTRKKVKIPSSFSSKAYLDSSFNVIKGKGKYRIRLKFDKSVANYICERVWHSSQKIQKHRDGSCTLALQLNSLDEIEHWVLGWGPSVKVLSPKELVLRVSSKLRSAAGMYRSRREVTQPKQNAWVKSPEPGLEAQLSFAREDCHFR